MTPDDKIAPPPDPVAREAAATLDELDPRGWTVPLVCKDCDAEFSVPYPHLRAGVVFHCAHCRGSFVPTTSIDRAVHAIGEEFLAACQRERDEFSRRGGDPVALAARQSRALEEFRARLVTLAHTMSPAGKLIRRAGVRAMFS